MTKHEMMSQLKHQALYRLPNLLRRRTTSTNWIPEIDGLRFIAISGVFVTHIYHFMLTKNVTATPGVLTELFLGTAGRGVEMFFAISGFILGLPFAKQHEPGARRVDIKRYFLRRVTRLEPPYVLVMVGLFLLRAFPLHSTLASKHDFGTLFASLSSSLAYGHWLLMDHRPYLNGIAWSLEVEVQFYVLAPLLATIIFRLGSVGLRLSMLLAVILVAPWIQQALDLSPNTILGQFQYFLLGFVLVEFHQREIFIRVPTFVNVLLSVSLFVLIFGLPIRHASPLNSNLFSILLLGFYILAKSPGWLQSFLSYSFVALTGGMCYSIYLLHYQIMLIVGSLTLKARIGEAFWPNFLLQLFMIGLTTLVLSTTFFLLIEKPCMDPDWPKKLRSKFTKSKTS